MLTPADVKEIEDIEKEIAKLRAFANNTNLRRKHMKYLLVGIIAGLLVLLFASWLTLNITQTVQKQGMYRMHEQRQLMQRHESEIIWQNNNSGKVLRPL
jgi:hypothetical protein